MDKSKNTVRTDIKLLQALIDLYLGVKVRSEEYVKNCKKEQIESERKSLLNTNPLHIIEYIKSSVNILLNLNNEQTNTQHKANESITSDMQENYEEQIQKLEAETRMHIRVCISVMIVRTTIEVTY